MRYNRFEISVIVQVVLLALSGFALVYSIVNRYLLVTILTAGFIWLGQIIFLISYVNRTNRDLNYFLQSVRYLDGMQPDESSRSFRRLNLTYNEIIDGIRKAQLEKEAEHHYFRTTIEHVGTGLISFNEQGVVGLVNRAALELLHVNGLQQLGELESRITGFPSMVQEMNPGQQKLVSFYRGNELVKLSVRATAMVIHGERIKLVSLANIRTELEEGELDAWQKLIRVLTHEIMNSVTPVKTLSTSVLRTLERSQNADLGAGLSEEDLENARSGLQAIEKRSAGLIGFVENYRSLNRIPRPVFSKVNVADLFQNVRVLLRSELEAGKARLETRLPDEGLTINLDEKLITQVLINLVGNALHALPAKDGEIVLNAFTGRDGSPVIEVIDNGAGIEKGELDRIFTPFYTTRQEGTGIGLSLSRQIMRLHRGSISAASEPGKETIFTLRF